MLIRFGRGEWIRTTDLQVLMLLGYLIQKDYLARYQAALHPAEEDEQNTKNTYIQYITILHYFLQTQKTHTNKFSPMTPFG